MTTRHWFVMLLSMSHLVFIQLLFLLHSIRLVISTLITLIPHPRKNFEKKNLEETACRSFARDQNVADYCFEVSSEGELEQVRPLLLHYLGLNKKVELIFSSPSVEAKCLSLQSQYPLQLRILRLPLLTIQSLKNWITAPVILFCRYDFYPELLLLKRYKKKFILLSGAVKKNSWYKKNVFRLFDVIVAATSREEERFRELNPDALIFAFDFRIQRITDRWKNVDNTLSRIPDLQRYLQYLKDIPLEQRIIMGSAWESDLPVFDDPQFVANLKNANIHVLIVPHQLGEESLRKIQDFFAHRSLENYVSVLNQKDPITPITILNISGILCELYSFFTHAYVGGGYERSIHSVFEPFFSGCQVYVGKKIHRSTEYDFLEEIAPNEIHVLFHPEQFYNVYMDNKKLTLNQNVRNFWREGSSLKVSQIAGAIGLSDVK